MRPATVLLRILPLLAFALAWTDSARAARECRDDLNEEDNYTIRSVVIEGRWAPRIPLPIKPGDRYSNAGIQRALRAVQEALHRQDREGFELQNFGAVGVVHITRCLLVEGREVDVIIQARSLRVDLINVGGNVLPIPRSGLATFYEAVPSPLLAPHPVFGAYQDKQYGFAPTAGISADLLALPQTMRGQAGADRGSRLDLALIGRKSVEHPFYNASVDLAFTSVRNGDLLEQSAFTIAYEGKDEPRSDQSFKRHAVALGGSVRMRPNLGILHTLFFGGNYRYSANDFTEDHHGEETGEHAAEFRVIAEGRAGGGFLRAALWADAAFPESGSDYRRVAGLAAFEKEFLVASNKTVGVEAIIGGGNAWSAPAYARFYGGNSDRNFLYDSLDSRALASFPNGPTIRSLGEGQGLAHIPNNDRGAESYWHVNLNISLPIPALSAPLIPDEEVAPGLTLKRLLKNKASDSVAFYAEELEEEGMTPAAALAKAQASYGEVRPAIEFIANRANVYALKPLFLCDVAGVDVPGQRHRVQSALGGGLQLTIVTAKMEIGYMHGVTGAAADSGNFFGRIVFVNLF